MPEGFSAQKYIEKKGVEPHLTKEGEVALQWNLLQPKKLEQKNGVVIFLPGVALTSNSKPVLESAQKYADANKSLAYSVSTRLDNVEAKNSQKSQASAILKFVQGRQLNNIIVVGNSQGANKSIDLVALLEENGINVRVLCMSNPAGVIEQDPDEVAENFYEDAVIGTPSTLLDQKIEMKSLSNIKKSLRLGGSVGFGIAKEAIGHPMQFSARKKRETVEAATQNDSAKKIKAKIIIFVGAKDAVFNSSKFIPPGAHKDIDEKGNILKSVRVQKKRGEEMKKVFPNSEEIIVVEFEKLSNHGGHFMRKVPEASIHLLERMERGERTI